MDRQTVRKKDIPTLDKLCKIDEDKLKDFSRDIVTRGDDASPAKILTRCIDDIMEKLKQEYMTIENEDELRSYVIKNIIFPILLEEDTKRELQTTSVSFSLGDRENKDDLGHGMD